jgi:hypothetical protein
LQQVRPWIGRTQSFEKNQLRLGKMLFSGMRFTRMISLLANAAVLLWAQAMLRHAVLRPLLADLLPFELSLEFET